MRHIGKVEVNQVINLVDRWVQEVRDQGFEEVSLKGGWEAWDDVKGGKLPYKLVKEARQEEVGRGPESFPGSSEKLSEHFQEAPEGSL